MTCLMTSSSWTPPARRRVSSKGRDRHAVHAVAAPRHSRPVRGVLLLPDDRLCRVPIDTGVAHRHGLHAGAGFRGALVLQLWRRRRSDRRCAAHSATRITAHDARHDGARGDRRVGHGVECAAPRGRARDDADVRDHGWHCSTRCRRRCLLWRHMPIRHRSAGRASARRSRSAASATCLAVYVGNYAINVGGPSAYFSSWAITMGVVFLSLAIVRHHIPRNPAVAVGDVVTVRR